MRGGSSSANLRSLESQTNNNKLPLSNNNDDDDSDKENHNHKVEPCLSQDTKRKGLFIITYLAYIAIYFARKPLSVLKPVLEKELGISRVALGNMDTVLLGSYAVGQLLLGQVGWNVIIFVFNLKYLCRFFVCHLTSPVTLNSSFLDTYILI